MSWLKALGLTMYTKPPGFLDVPWRLVLASLVVLAACTQNGYSLSGRSEVFTKPWGRLPTHDWLAGSQRLVLLSTDTLLTTHPKIDPTYLISHAGQKEPC